MTAPREFDPAKLAMNSADASSVAEAVGSRPAVMEPKYDGIRLLVHVSDTGVRMYARSGNSKTGRLPDIEAELAAKLPAGTWLDCEAVAFRADGTQNWGEAQSVLGSAPSRVMDRSRIRLVVFDLLAHGGLDARRLTLAQRRELLVATLDEADFDRVIASKQTAATDEEHAANLEAGYEGSMVKHTDAVYQSGQRSQNSLKLKATDTVDAVIVGFGEAEPGSWIAKAGMVGKIIFQHVHEGEWVEGKCSGMTVDERREITDMQADLIGRVVEVSYMTRMPGGKLRHPQFQRLRDDKTADEVAAG